MSVRGLQKKRLVISDLTKLLNRTKASVTVVFILIHFSHFSQSIKDTSRYSALYLSSLSIDALMNIEVSTVSRKPIQLNTVPSAIQVITGNDIRRSGVTRLPEALNLAPNLQVLQANSHSWSITSRGFSGLPSAGGIIANKLLVMIDGRSIYTPLFGGVYWDVQNVMLQDVDKIEVISGPGGTLWGANAVNGVINIVTKSAKETQGLYISGTAGSFLKDQFEMRFGGRSVVDKNLYFRIYAQRYDQNSALLSGIGSDTISTAWNMTQGGFRMDYLMHKKVSLTFQGDIYVGDENEETQRSLSEGQNLLARLTSTFSDKSILTIQSYYDHAYRRLPNSKNEFYYDLYAVDIDIDHRYSINRWNKILYGVGLRNSSDKTSSGFDPANRKMPLYTAFVMDDITLVPDKLTFTIGSKFLHNVFTGFEYQPSARLSYLIKEKNILWSSVSRAVRTPSRFDHDLLTVDDFKSEKLVAYEIGYRFKPIDQFSLSFASFYNNYYDLRSIDSANIDSDPELEIALANSQEAKSWGFEFSFKYVISDYWQVRGGYTYFDKDISATHSMVHPLSYVLESIESKHQILIQSMFTLPKNFQVDFVLSCKDKIPEDLPIPGVPAFVDLDLRLGWTYRFMEISFVGQNLIKEEHTETGVSKIPRSIYAKIALNL